MSGGTLSFSVASAEASGAGVRWFAADGLALELLGGAADRAAETVATADGAPPLDPTLAAAVALAAREPLLGCLERWLGETYDWTPWPVARPDAAAPTTLAADLVLRRRSAPDEAIALRLDAARLARLAGRAPPPDADVEGVFRRVAVDVVLDELALDAAEASALVPGAVLLLPAAFAERWRLRLVARGDEALAGACEAIFDPERGRAERRIGADDGGGEGASDRSAGRAHGADGVGVPVSDTAAIARVLVERPLDLELPRWRALEAGHGDGAVAVPDAHRARVVLADRACHGSLARLGRGWALRLDPARDP